MNCGLKIDWKIIKISLEPEIQNLNHLQSKHWSTKKTFLWENANNIQTQDEKLNTQEKLPKKNKYSESNSNFIKIVNYFDIFYIF